MMNRKLVAGIGINDYPENPYHFKTVYENGVSRRELVWYCPAYRCWNSLLNRRGHRAMAPEWLRFSVFREWFYTHFKPGLHVSIGLLDTQAPIGPDTTTFVPTYMSIALRLTQSKESVLPPGVRHFRRGRFTASITEEGRTVPLGVFDSLLDAHIEYLKAKYDSIRQKVVKYQTESFKDDRLVNRIYNALETLEKAVERRQIVTTL